MSLDETGRIKLVQPASGKTFERRGPGTYERGAWNDDKIALLRKLYHDGLSCSQIAARIGGVTRNSVIGKVHRMGLALRGHKNNRVTKKQRNDSPGKNAWALEKAVFGDRRGLSFLRGSAKSSTTEPLPPRHETDIARVSFIELEDRHCRWIASDPAGPHEKQFCGIDRAQGTPYCEHHARRAYQTVALPSRKYLCVATPKGELVDG